MSGSLPVTKRLTPPIIQTPIADDGTYTQPWAAYHQDVADRLASMDANMGVTNGSDATAGQIGEYLTATGGAVTLSNNVAANVATLALTPGDWEVSGLITFSPAATTHPTQIAASISTASNTLQAPAVLSAAFNVGSPLSLSPPPGRVNVSAATTVYLVALATFTTAGMTAAGSMQARRMR